MVRNIYRKKKWMNSSKDKNCFQEGMQQQWVAQY